MKSDVRGLYRNLFDHTGDYAPLLEPVVSVDSHQFNDKTAQLNQWTNHFSNLLNIDVVVQINKDLASFAGSIQKLPTEESKTFFTLEEI
jgi:hypothetical protein